MKLYSENKNYKLYQGNMLGVLEQLYNLGVPMENGFTDEYYNNFDEIRDYILNYGN